MEGIAWVRMYACKAVEYVFNLVNDTDSLGHWICKKMLGKDIGAGFGN